ncbi:hypothetical protein [Rehaibacterium terrae]|uniref:Uncharacterized protein n=1 Tax=Rehaibacterium terrae TaxID=1341696 RepID=A0A7W7XYU1_9GAMM|nr:hypothetical protein [Rehaibacterium terrae]MBB5014964.1 hypothetical protein [Rehaibacterium terrae]
MSEFARRLLRRLGIAIVTRRTALRMLIAIGGGAIVLDGFFGERSLQHLLIGHTALGLVLFVALLVVEAARPPRRGARP